MGSSPLLWGKKINIGFARRWQFFRKSGIGAIKGQKTNFSQTGKKEAKVSWGKVDNAALTAAGDL